MSKNKERLVILFCTLCLVFCPIGIFTSIRVALKHSDLMLLMICAITGLSYLLLSEINKNIKLKDRIETLNIELESFKQFINKLLESIGEKP